MTFQSEFDKAISLLEESGFVSKQNNIFCKQINKEYSCYFTFEFFLINNLKNRGYAEIRMNSGDRHIKNYQKLFSFILNNMDTIADLADSYISVSVSASQFRVCFQTDEEDGLYVFINETKSELFVIQEDKVTWICHSGLIYTDTNRFKEYFK